MRRAGLMREGVDIRSQSEGERPRPASWVSRDTLDQRAKGSGPNPRPYPCWRVGALLTGVVTRAMLGRGTEDLAPRLDRNSGDGARANRRSKHPSSAKEKEKVVREYEVVLAVGCT